MGEISVDLCTIKHKRWDLHCSSECNPTHERPPTNAELTSHVYIHVYIHVVTSGESISSVMHDGFIVINFS